MRCLGHPLYEKKQKDCLKSESRNILFIIYKWSSSDWTGQRCDTKTMGESVGSVPKIIPAILTRFEILKWNLIFRCEVVSSILKWFYELREEVGTSMVSVQLVLHCWELNMSLWQELVRKLPGKLHKLLLL